MSIELKIVLTVLVALLGFVYGEVLDVEYSYRNKGLGIPPHPLDYVFGCWGMAALTSAIASLYLW